MATMKLKGEALKFFKKVGSSGGKNRAKKFPKAQISAWSRRGGRPPLKSLKEREDALLKKHEKIMAYQELLFSQFKTSHAARLIERTARYEKRRAGFIAKFNAQRAALLTREKAREQHDRSKSQTKAKD